MDSNRHRGNSPKAVTSGACVLALSAERNHDRPLAVTA
jgi:hypothetical protein